MKAVLKIGGSFQKSSSLKDLCKVIEDITNDSSHNHNPNHNIVIVPGGGVFADQVRNLQDKHNLSDEIVHLMAIKTMEIYGLALKDLIPNVKITDALEEVKKNSAIFLSYKTLKNQEDLEPTWKITSDSIAAFICGKIGYKNLILIKRSDFKGKKEISTKKLKKINQNTVDSKLASFLEKFRTTCYIVDGEKPNRVKRILNRKETNYTKIHPVK